VPVAFAVLALALALQDPEPALAGRVNRAIARGVSRLRAQQLETGHWPGAEGEHPGGMTALAAFTLLKSGVRRGDPALERAARAIAATEFASTYSHSVRLLYLDALADPARARQQAAASLDFLVANQGVGAWAYPWGAADASNTQFALLGLRAAHRLGLEVPERTIELAADAIWRWCARDGGFSYAPDQQATGGITAATLAGLAVLDELARGSPAAQRALAKHAKEREAAARWLSEHFDPARNAYGPRAWTPGFHYAYLWAVERYGGLSRLDAIGGRDWYALGAEWLVADQHHDGAWGRGIEDTCFALLFLRRATLTSGDDAPPPDDAGVGSEAPPPPVEPSGDLVRLADWLVCGPWKSKEPNLILLEPPFDPAKLRPKLGDKLARREWRRVALKPDGWTNLEQLASLASNVTGEQELWIAAATIAWRGVEPLEATLWFDFEDGWDVYVDGVRRSFSQRVAAAIDGRVKVDVDLAPGEHSLVVLIEENTGDVPFGARISDRAGAPLGPEIEVYAVPPRAAKR
jgi:hypothetical protein